MKALALDAGQQEQLRCLEFQGRLTSSLLGYADAMTTAFEFLGQAHAAMKMQGACDVDGTGTTEKMLFESFRDAHAAACYLAGTARMALETSQATLQACADDLEKADEAAAQVQRYNKQLQACKSTDTASWRCRKVQGKLEPAVHLAGVSLTRAQDSLNGCVSRQGDLCQVARQLVEGTSAALRDAIRPLQPREACPQACNPNQVLAPPSPSRRYLTMTIAGVSDVSVPATPSSLEEEPVKSMLDTSWIDTSASSDVNSPNDAASRQTSPRADASSTINEDVNSLNDAASRQTSPREMVASHDETGFPADSSTPTRASSEADAVRS
eukprot:CAMPEP_0197659906 /NCGR_PEP_ID=MMETSP1338-20131121/49650_1 /TAXON_ID=43686 ORGANISM="Pelagodinium beii, Strain RCC1491" /NCGR_SAMPLE_ID=MMETSP1338 /ASSEMBLY_ACC=CAM_ASM_000754 /LENGTH=325 /DNA_ID=CAMNT_0043237089 /DNA_START=79 /DNA_END=1056 /DNA_ORIENTATION=+